VRWSRIISAPRALPDGSLVWDGIQIDTTDQKRAQAALEHLNETLERRVEERTADRDRMWRLSTDLMLVARFDGTITAVNPAWTTLLGWREEDLIGLSFLDFVHPDDRDATALEAGHLGTGRPAPRFEDRAEENGHGDADTETATRSEPGEER